MTGSRSETPADKRPSAETAARAKAEAEARRPQIDARTESALKEVNGRGGRDPARFGDWEIKGMASDF